MFDRRTLFSLLVVTLFSVGVVEGGYLALEYLLLREPGKAAPVSAAGPVPVVVGEGEGYDHRIILQRNLFGGWLPEGGTALTPSSPRRESGEGSGLDIVLLGTVGGDIPRAVFFDKKSQRQQLYSLGETIEDAVIREIRRGEVVVFRQGREEVLDWREAATIRPSLPSAGESAALPPVAVVSQPVDFSPVAAESGAQPAGDGLLPTADDRPRVVRLVSPARTRDPESVVGNDGVGGRD